MNAIATIGPRLLMFCGVNAGTIFENIRQGRVTFCAFENGHQFMLLETHIYIFSLLTRTI